MTRRSSSVRSPESHPSEGADAARQLRDALGIDDPAARSGYVRRYQHEFELARWSTSSFDALIEAATACEVVLLGEYHPLPGACETARALVERLGGAVPLAVGLEMVHARDQQALDALAAGAIGRREFASRIRYEEEWGYPLGAALDLVRAAAARGVPVVGLDIPPRGRVEDLRLRDEVAAARIAAGSTTLSGEKPLWIVVYGEAHLASEHLPAEISSALGREAAIVRVLHDLEPGPPAGRGWFGAAQRTFTCQRAGPGARVPALARVYRRWAAQELAPDGLDLGLLAHELIDDFALQLGIDPRRRRVGPALWLADLYPPLFGPGESARAGRRLREAGIRGRRRSELQRTADRRGVLFVESPRMLLAPSPSMPALAREGARFLCRAMRPVRPPVPPVRLALEAAVAQLLSVRVDPGVVPTSRPGPGDGRALARAADAAEAGDGEQICRLLGPGGGLDAELASRLGGWIGGRLAARSLDGSLDTAELGRRLFPPGPAGDDLTAVADICAEIGGG
jgi:hypothetical protein